MTRSDTHGNANGAADAPPNTLFLRLEGPLQAWGNSSRFVIRRTADEPTRSGVLGLICAAEGVRRAEAPARLEELDAMTMGVRLDRPGVLLRDYHTVGARDGVMQANRKDVKRTATTGELEAVVSLRDYLCDASFLVALHGEPTLIASVAEAVRNPVWPPCLGRACCPPSRPVFDSLGRYDDLSAALAGPPFLARPDDDIAIWDADGRITLPAVLEVPRGEPIPPDAQARQDRAVRFSPPWHAQRYVVRADVTCPTACQRLLPPDEPEDFRKKQMSKTARKQAFEDACGLCVFCKAEAKEAHHRTYERFGDELPEDLVPLCELCHAAVTMLEYAAGFAGMRIDPTEPQWTVPLRAARQQILNHRGQAARRRHR